ncbi:MAG TPA: NADH:flavin oxidoreductase/NADH oxidase [Vicinamibacterales bacterium]|nr:NADH:flavin oxidoreductase/NADH oxidase [Vicinamibacterales bacterium]
MPHLFDPLTLRSVTFPHRVVVSPMCQYSSVDGFADEWHFVHLGSRAVGGAALVMTEAAAVSPEGRISPQDLGVYDEGHIAGLARIVRFVHAQHSLAGIQIAHAGRKGSTHRPWSGSGALSREQGGWQPVAPTADAFAPNFPVPCALTAREIATLVAAFRQAAQRALRAGFDVVEIHAAHGYLLHEFLSPLVNTRTDEYGGSYDNRVRFCLEVASAVREVWPERLPLFVRLSCTDWKAGGWDLEQTVELARRLEACGVDLIDCSSGGLVVDQQIAVGPGYQVPFAERVRRDAAIATGAVGLITGSAQANAIVEQGQADLVLLARELLRDPYFPLRAARELGREIKWPPQYVRAAAPGTAHR